MAEHVEPVRIGRRGFARRDDLGNEFQSPQKVGITIRLDETRVALAGGQNHLSLVAGRVKDANSAERRQLFGNVCAKTAIGEAHIDKGEVGLVMRAENDSLGDRSGNPAHFVTVLNKDFFGHIRDHKIVFDNQHLGHLAPSSNRSREARERKAVFHVLGLAMRLWRPGTLLEPQLDENFELRNVDVAFEHSIARRIHPIEVQRIDRLPLAVKF